MEALTGSGFKLSKINLFLENQMKSKVKAFIHTLVGSKRCSHYQR